MTIHVSSRRRLATIGLATIGLAIALTVTGCSGSVSVGGKTIAQSELEDQIAAQLAATVEADTAPVIACPGDLDAEVGASITCELTDPAVEGTLPVFVDVTEVNDGVASFSIEVGTA